jgi:crotonobetainyl-CoA:carnitine CoA-transferase CaiB-like acyl-CoA transferase
VVTAGIQRQEKRKMSEGALSGLKVLEFDDGLGQFCGKLLADLGADVIKVEPPGGAPARYVGPYAADVPGVNRSLTFWHYNTNKKSVTLDLNRPDAVRIVKDLVREYDIVLDATADGLEGLGLGAEALRNENEGLIFQRITAFGSTGPWSGYAGSDVVSQALGGVTAMNGYDEKMDLPPISPTGGQAAHLTSMYAAIAVLGAVNHRDISGDGQDIDVAAHDVIAVSTELSIPYWEFKKARVFRQTARHARPDPDTPQQVVRCKDGKYIIALSLYLFDEMRFPAMVDWMASENMAEDLTEDLYKDPEHRFERIAHINNVVHKFCNAHDSEWLFHGAQKRRLPWSPLHRPGELINDKHLRERGALATLVHDGEGEVVYPGRPYALSETPWSLRTPAPDLGADTVEVLRGLGRSENQIVELHDARVL